MIYFQILSENIFVNYFIYRQSFKYFENFSGTVPNCSTAVQLVKLLVGLADRGESTSLNNKISKLI